MADDHELRHDPGAREDDVDDEDLDAREEARVRRRDRELAAERDALMRPGMGKVFKQIQDSWGEKATPSQDRARKGAPRAPRGHGSRALSAGVSAEAVLPGVRAACFPIYVISKWPPKLHTASRRRRRVR